MDPDIHPTNGNEGALPIGTIVFENVVKHYDINTRASPRVGGWLLNKAFEYFRRERFSALEDVSFRIEPGEMVGFLGANGAGKSTCLKLIAGITDPSGGRVHVSGPVTSLLELGIGFHPELTGMENIFQSGIMMGLTRRQILDRLPQIIDFSGVHEFLNEPIKHYSSGMYSRLACSVALHVEPRIILLDEILAVGDAEFQTRATEKLLQLHDTGVTVVLVTHATQTAREMCDRLIWIDNGIIRGMGDPVQVHGDYTRFMNLRKKGTGPFHCPPDTGGTEHARITAARLLVEGRETNTIQTGEPFTIEVQVEGKVPAARLGIAWRWKDGYLLNEDLSEPFALENGRATIQYITPDTRLLKSQVEATLILCSVDETAVFDRISPALDINVETEGYDLPEFLLYPRVEWEATRIS
ncbi:MAG: ATP-binding cassette domain-containing protein [Candidatus Sumerlaeia bacterium]|nr:ATP-binding cassette domain-containing protein [Candidatus Sumerlaeia bacterium]